MAKKINFKTVDEVNRAHAALTDFSIEHVLVKYPLHPKGDDTDKTNHYIVVLNRLKNDAIVVLNEAKLSPSGVKNARHYEAIALAHKHYQPTFDCKCRHCGKTFKHVDKHAAWCSKECRKQFRIAKKQQS